MELFIKKNWEIMLLNKGMMDKLKLKPKKTKVSLIKKKFVERLNLDVGFTLFKID